MFKFSLPQYFCTRFSHGKYDTGLSDNDDNNNVNIVVLKMEANCEEFPLFSHFIFYVCISWFALKESDHRNWKKATLKVLLNSCGYIINVLLPVLSPVLTPEIEHNIVQKHWKALNFGLDCFGFFCTI